MRRALMLAVLLVLLLSVFSFSALAAPISPELNGIEKVSEDTENVTIPQPTVVVEAPSTGPSIAEGLLWGTILIGLAVVVGLAFWSVPAVIAYKKRKVHRVAILWLTILTGWSLIGWVAAFIWCIMDESGE